MCIESSVADSDPGPVGSGLFGSPGSGSGKIQDLDPLSSKDPCNSNFLVIKLSKIQFRPNNFLSLILSVIRCLDLVRKCHKKNI